MHEPTAEEADQLPKVRTLLEELCEEGERAVAAEDVDATVAVNARFHGKVMEPAGNAVLAGLAAQVESRVRWYYTPVARQRGRQSWIEHRKLIAAITARDERSATRLMREHTEHTRRSYHARGES